MRDCEVCNRIACHRHCHWSKGSTGREKHPCTPEGSSGRSNISSPESDLERLGVCSRHASAALQDDREVVTTAISDDASAFKFASTRLRSDEAIVLAALRKWGGALEHAGESFRSD